MGASCWLLACSIALLCMKSSLSFLAHPNHRFLDVGCRPATYLMADPDLQGKPGMKGYYRRPSRAIEKGGGFFVPGLEGEKIRVSTATVLILMVAANRLGNQQVQFNQIVSELCAISAAVWLFVQGIVDFFSASEVNLQASDQNYLTVVQKNGALSGKVQSLANALTASSNDILYVVVAAQDEIIFQLSPIGQNSVSPTQIDQLRTVAARGDKESVVLDKNSFNKFEMGGLKLSQETESVVLHRDSRSWLWLVASRKSTTEMEKAIPWLETVASAPI